MLKVVSFKICPFVQRVTASLEVKNIPYEIEYISLKNKPQWFLDVSPNGQVPLLITDSGIALFESDAIVEYIEDIAAPNAHHLLAEQKALDRAWSYMATKNYLTQCSMMRSTDRETFLQRTNNLRKTIAKIECEINKGQFFNRAGMSKVDIAWLPLLHRANIFREHTGYDLLDGFPNVQKWQTSIMATDIVTRSVAKDFEAEFVSFYLSESTFLAIGNVSASVQEGCLGTTCC